MHDALSDELNVSVQCPADDAPPATEAENAHGLPVVEVKLRAMAGTCTFDTPGPTVAEELSRGPGSRTLQALAFHCLRPLEHPPACGS